MCVIVAAADIRVGQEISGSSLVPLGLVSLASGSLPHHSLQALNP